jgi:2-C-methyl-D-erythritol 2,4-cyclodiphosphate synthase
MSSRVGIGFDAHRLVEGRELVLGGERIEYERGLAGHSDGDVLLHALADALLGAVAAPDIGALFPSSDPTWQGVPSRQFLEKARAIVEEKGFRVQQVDVVVIAQSPTIAAYIPSIRNRLAGILGIPVESIGLKATTTDGMGFTGRGEGIAVHAVATVIP